MQIGAFCTSLAVKDLAASKAFYEKFGFKPTSGNGKQWLVLRNGGHVIGLFQGLFERKSTQGSEIHEKPYPVGI